ncbi:MAG TPA: CBS domain-containing protein [Actinomycetota bacterium]|nr:CBS domain-containing protein [Actinomycetota bacterium]
MNDIKVGDVMTNMVVTLRPQDPISEAARRLVSNRISGAPVVEDGRLVGIISEADLVAAYAEPPRTGSAYGPANPLMFLIHGRVPAIEHKPTVADVMTADVVKVSADTSIWEAASLIDRHGIRRLPVVDSQDVVVGVLARADLVRVMARSNDDLRSAVRENVEILGSENFRSLEVEALDGVITVHGTVDRKSTRDLALHIASSVPGVLQVVDELDWDWDDTSVKPDHLGRGQDPWAVGPLVKEVS